MGRTGGVTADRYVVSLRGDENGLKLDSGDDCTTLNMLKAIEWYVLNG